MNVAEVLVVWKPLAGQGLPSPSVRSALVDRSISAFLKVFLQIFFKSHLLIIMTTYGKKRILICS